MKSQTHLGTSTVHIYKQSELDWTCTLLISLPSGQLVTLSSSATLQFILEGETDPLDSSAGYQSPLAEAACSPAKQQLCRYQNTNDIRYGAKPSDVHLFFFFVACFHFPFCFLCFLFSAMLLTVLRVSQSLKNFQGIQTKSKAPSVTWWWRWCSTNSLCVGLVTVERSRKLKLCYYGGGPSQSGLVILFHFPR